nr:ribonuclease H-like domain-containing protein [Tanacetum cinerariifolium]
MEAGATTTMTVKLHILNPGEYILWLMRIEQYFLMTDYSFWEVIKNGNKVLTKHVGSSEQTCEPTTTEEKQDKRNEMKARGTLLMALPNKDQLKFHSYKDAKLLMEAIEKKYRGNKESKKVQRALLKQQYKNFATSKLETIILDDLYTKSKIYEPEISGSSNTNQNPQNMDFVSSKSTSSTNEADTTVSEVSTAHTQGTIVNSTSVDNLSDAMISRSLDINGRRIGFDKTKVECFKCHKNGHFARECRALRNQDNKGREYGRTTVPVETPTKSALIAQDGIGGSNSEGTTCPSKRDLRLIGEHFESESVDVSTVSLSIDKTVKTLDITHKGMLSTEEPTSVMKNNFVPPIIEDWHSDDDSKDELSPTVEVKTVKLGVEKIESVKTPRETVKIAESHKPHKHYPRGNKTNWNNLMSYRLRSNIKMITKACYVCGSFEHLQYVCDKKDVRPIRNNSNRVNHKKIANKFTYPHPKRGFIPQAVLTRSTKINNAATSVNTVVRPINADGSQSTVNHSRPISKVILRRHPQQTRPFNKLSSNKRIVFNKKVNTIMASACWVWKAKNSSASTTFKKYSYIDARGNKCYLTDFEAFDGGFVSFGDGKGRISGKGKIKTGKLSFDDVYFCKELKYNLFNVSQMCDKKNNVLFTDTECLVLSSNFKLLDESQVLLRVSRKDNIYSVDLKSVVPTGGLTSLFAKAILNESNLWHRRLGHINFKTMNKLVKENLVRGIKREYSVARTPQQNGVAKRRNRTLIKAVRTMLVDSKLPTTFWAEAVNIACYVLNRALVTKPHNKTPYELICGRHPLIDFMKPFGCLVTILNTKDNLGKFEGKADEGYFVGYSVKKVSKLLKWRKSRSGGLRRLMKIGSGRRVKSPLEKDSLGAQEDASKQGRMIEEIDLDDEIILDVDTQGRKNDDQMFGVDDLCGEEVVLDTTTGEHEEQIIEDVSTAEPINTAATTAVPTPRAKGIVFHEQKQSHIPTVSSSKDKGKAKMIDPEVLIKKKDQIRKERRTILRSLELMTLLKFLEYLVRVHVSLVTDGDLMSWYMVPLQKAHMKPTSLLMMISSHLFEKIEKVKSLHPSSRRKIIRENVFCLGGNRDHVPTCLCYMLYCVANFEKFNLAHFMAKQMERVTKQARLILPYGMLLTCLFDFIIDENPKLQNESYVLYDRVMNPLAAQLERKPRKDRGMRRGRHSTSFSNFNEPSSSHLNNDDDDGNNEWTSRASTPSPIRYVNSLTNQVPQLFQNPPNIDPHLEPFYTRQTKIINRQVQLRDEQRSGVRSIKKSLRRLWRNMKKRDMKEITL